MARKTEPVPDDPEQAERFIKMAREIGAAETEDEARKGFAKVASPKPAHKKRD